MQHETMIRIAQIIALAILAALAQISQAELRCGSSLISTGDWPLEVEDSCGPPDYIAEYPTGTVPGLGVVQTEEHWYYNSGPQRFIRRLIFRNGKLVAVDDLGYGFHVSDAPACSPSALRHAKTEYDLVARCGQPASKRVEWQTPDHRRLAQSRRNLNPVLVQEWLYEFSSNEFRQVVTLQNGRVVDIESRPGR